MGLSYRGDISTHDVAYQTGVSRRVAPVNIKLFSVCAMPWVVSVTMFYPAHHWWCTDIEQYVDCYCSPTWTTLTTSLAWIVGYVTKGNSSVSTDVASLIDLVSTIWLPPQMTWKMVEASFGALIEDILAANRPIRSEHGQAACAALTDVLASSCRYHFEDQGKGMPSMCVAATGHSDMGRLREYQRTRTCIAGSAMLSV